MKRDDLKEYLQAPEDFIVPEAKDATDWAVELCTVGALALYLWFRFDIQLEQWPQWQNGFEWQSIKLLKASGSQFAPFKYDTQLKDIKRLFEKHDVHLKSLTHSGQTQVYKLC